LVAWLFQAAGTDPYLNWLNFAPMIVLYFEKRSMY
jgi:hypothetical protein